MPFCLPLLMRVDRVHEWLPRVCRERAIDCGREAAFRSSRHLASSAAASFKGEEKNATRPSLFLTSLLIPSSAPHHQKKSAPLPSTAARRLPAWTTRKHPSSPLLVGEEAKQHLQAPSPPLPTPPAADSGAEPLFPGTSRKRGPPTLLQRLAAAVFYLVPYIDVVEMGNTILKTFPQMQGIHNIPREFGFLFLLFVLCRAPTPRSL